MAQFPDDHPNSSTCGHLEFPHPQIENLRMKKEKVFDTKALNAPHLAQAYWEVGEKCLATGGGF